MIQGEEELQANLAKVEERICRAALKAGRERGEIQLLAVTKTWPVEILEKGLRAGLRSFGENKVQELEEKVPRLPPDVEWHLIGHLQKNKVRKAVKLAGVFQTIDSLALAQRVDQIAAEQGCKPRVYWQVNLGEEESKSGWRSEDLLVAAESLLSCEHLHVEGLMAIPPFTAKPEDSRAAFVALRTLRDQLAVHCGREFPGLSMGMSHDFEVAIEEGATVVRVGSAIFGARSPK